MRLDEIIRGIQITDRRGSFESDVTGITTDSRRVKPGELFVAVRGVEADGHDFIPEALEQGATSVMGEAWPESADEVKRPNVVLVPNARRALALAAANFYGQPSRKLLVAGVTGTNGKTTVTYVLESIIRAASKKVGVIGSIDTRFSGQTLSANLTTPDAVALQRTLAQMVDAGVSHVAMEVSSHALDQQRVAGVHFKVAGFTNLSQDHLDYHKSMQTYFEAKARLFSEYLRKSRARGRMAVVNVDDEKGQELIERWGGKTLRVSLNPDADADVVALEQSYGLDGVRAKVRTSKGIWDLETALLGPHNLSNVLVAVGMALAMGFSKQRILRGLEALERVPGRLEKVSNDDGKHVLVDYAHTPDALAKSLSSVKPLSEGRLIVVFGCGGDRDEHKRPQMGAAVAAHADLALVTNDNPRNEDPRKIAAAIEPGLKEAGWSKATGQPAERQYAVELDRRHAIRVALDTMRAGDVLVIAGKGHETYQIIGDQKMHFDDRDEARRMLSGLPPPPPLTYDDQTSEVGLDQVEEALEIVDGSEIIAEVADGPNTQQVDASAIVDEIDEEPDIVSEEADVEDDDASANHSPPKEEKT